jgi:methionine synthase I (cobalamin-dependent)
MALTLKEILSDGPVLLDGGWGTQLQERGLPIGANADIWNLTEPDKVESVARAYVEAGSGIILTNTFQASPFALERHGYSDKTAEINRSGAAISKKAAGDRARVFASVGPSGKMLAMGEISAEELEEGFALQIGALVEGGADGIVIETMSDPEETAIAVKAAKRFAVPVVACLCFDSGKGLDRTMMGTTPELGVEILEAVGADAVGANCGQGIESYVAICQRLSAASSLPVWIKANAGLPELIDGRAVYTTTAEQFAGHLPALIEAGASFVGGCCGTTPEFIRAAREVLEK